MTDVPTPTLPRSQPPLDAPRRPFPAVTAPSRAADPPQAPPSGPPAAPAESNDAASMAAGGAA